MRIGDQLQDWIEIGAWQMFARWSKIDLDPELLDDRERWSVVRAVVLAVIRSRYLQPARFWLLACAPAWLVTRRLERRTRGWYRVPSRAAAEHVRLRFDMWPIDVGDHVRVEGGRLTAVGYATPNFTEIIFVLPDGELEPDPRSSEMSRALGAYRAAITSLSTSVIPSSEGGT
jgi:hypothetical protein